MCIYKRKALKMEKRFDAKRFSTRMVLTVLIVATILIFTGSGCSRWRRSSVKDNQLKMQNMIQNNAQQIVRDAALIEEIIAAVNDIEQRQAKLQEEIKAAQSETILLREKMIVVLTQLKDELSRISSSGMAGR